MAAKLKDSEGKIAEKDKEIEELTKQIEELENTADAILAAGANAQTELVNMKKQANPEKNSNKPNNSNNSNNNANPPGDNDMLNDIKGVGE
jgi:predicted flap endonuclease-1-like 5' DNA nuclease